MPHQNLTLPFTRSYWVIEGGFLAGCYPGAPDTAEAERKLKGLVDCGIRCVINLMEPDETDHSGKPFVSYEQVMSEYAARKGIEIEFHRMPIKDLCTTTSTHMRQILDVIDNAMTDGKPVYVHCWGGKGRTGTVVGCWLARQGITGEAALERIKILRSNEPTVHQASPETHLQREMVRLWLEGE